MRVYVLRRTAAPQQVARYEDRIVSATIGPDDAIYGVSRAGAPNGKILKLAAPYGGFALAKRQCRPRIAGVAILDGGERPCR